MKKTLTLLLLLAGLTLQARAAELTWNGSADHMTWNTDLENLNWLSGSTETAYTNGSGVTFGDAGCGEVTLVGELEPAYVWVSNSPGSDYTFTGEGEIAGDSCTLTKYGEGRLTINTANSFHATTLNAGTLALGNAAALGSGYITLNGGTLDLGNQTIANEVSVMGNASIGNGAVNGDLVASSGTTLTLCGDLEGTGWISPGLNFTLNLGGKTLSNVVMLSFDASIGNGTLNGTVRVDQTLTVFGETHIGESGAVSAGGTISLADNATLDLGGKALSNAITLQGNATIGNGTLNGYSLKVSSGKKLTLYGGLGGSNRIYLDTNSTLDLGDYTLSKDVYLLGSASIGNGTLDKEHDVEVSSGNTLTLCGDLKGEGGILLDSASTLDLNGKTLSNAVSVREDARIGNGTLNGTVRVGQTLTVFGETHIGESGAVSAGGTISLTDNATLDLGGKALSNAITLQGNATIGNGTLNGNSLKVSSGKKLTLYGGLGGSNRIYLDTNSTLDLGDYTLSKGVYLLGSASIGNGTLDKEHDVDVSSGNTLTLCGDLKGEGWILLDSASTLDLNGKTLSNAVVVREDARIGNGTLNGDVDAVTPSKTIAFFGETHLKGGTITPGSTAIKALKEDKEGLLQELGVSDGLIAGTDRQASLADGLEISRMGDNLKLENLILTDNNRISVGDGNTITLNNVTIKISNDVFSQMVPGEYLFTLADLFHCSVDMTDVTFDASELHLPEGFNPATDSISFNLGDAKLTEATARQNITLLLGGYGSQTMSINGYGRPVFTKLVPTPEPATGTLSLLALAALAARRRK